MATIQTRDNQGFRFIDEGPSSGKPVVMLHGMLGSLDNWAKIVIPLARNGYRAIAPLLPVYRLPMEQTSVSGLSEYTDRFLSSMDITHPVLVGNSLGGHVALVYSISGRRPISGLVLTGASGIHEVILGNSKPRRYDKSYVREKARLTFHDPTHVTDDLVEEVLNVVRHRPSALRLIKIARSAKKDTVRDRLGEIGVPSLLIWGRQDRLTPPQVAIDFGSRMKDARLELIDECGHAPMIERPEVFSSLLLDFLASLEYAGKEAENGARSLTSAPKKW